MGLMIDAVKEGRRGTCNRIIKVSHASEFGAVNIYRAQFIVARQFVPSLVPQLEVFLAHEKRHLATFAEVLRARGVGGFALGWVTSLFGRSGIMACRAAVETVVTGHLVEQLAFLESQGDMEAAAAVKAIASEEEEHKAVGIIKARIVCGLNRWVSLSRMPRPSWSGSG